MVPGCHDGNFSCFSLVVLYPQQVEAACGSVLIAVNIFFLFVVAEASSIPFFFSIPLLRWMHILLVFCKCHVSWKLWGEWTPSCVDMRIGCCYCVYFALLPQTWGVLRLGEGKMQNARSFVCKGCRKFEGLLVLLLMRLGYGEFGLINYIGICLQLFSGYTHEEGLVWAIVTVWKSKNGVKKSVFVVPDLRLGLVWDWLEPGWVLSEWLKVLIVCLSVFFFAYVLIKCLCFCHIWVGWVCGQMFSLILFLHKRHIIMYLIINLGCESPF